MCSCAREYGLGMGGRELDGDSDSVCVCHWGYLAGARVLFKRERVFSFVSQLNARSQIQQGGVEEDGRSGGGTNTASLVVPHSHYLLWPPNPRQPPVSHDNTHISTCMHSFSELITKTRTHNVTKSFTEMIKGMKEEDVGEPGYSIRESLEMCCIIGPFIKLHACPPEHVIDLRGKTSWFKLSNPVSSDTKNCQV